MKQILSYAEAIEIFAREYKGKDGMFGASTLLCHLFDTDDKEKMLQDLMNTRERK